MKWVSRNKPWAPGPGVSRGSLGTQPVETVEIVVLGETREEVTSEHVVDSLDGTHVLEV